MVAVGVRGCGRFGSEAPPIPAGLCPLLIVVAVLVVIGGFRSVSAHDAPAATGMEGVRSASIAADVLANSSLTAGQPDFSESAVTGSPAGGGSGTESPEDRGHFVEPPEPPVVNTYEVGDYELRLRDGALVFLRGPVEHQVVSTKTVETGSTYRVGAVCSDGTHSSATGRGACSWHGGVANWLVARDTKQVRETSTVVRTEMICQAAACPLIEGSAPASNIEAAARYVPILNSRFDIRIPGRLLEERTGDPEEVKASSLIPKRVERLRALMR